MPFKKGQSGNPGGRPKTKLFTEALRKQLDEKQLESIAKRLVREALVGSFPLNAIREIADRLEGKVPQAITNDEDQPFKQIIQVVTGVPRA